MSTETPTAAELERCDPARGHHVWPFSFSQLPTNGARCQCGARRHEAKE